MSSQSKFPSTGASAGGGDVAWTSAGNITADDSFVAQVTLSAGQDSDFLEASDFGFSIPSGATINGIQVRVKRYGMGTVDDVSVRLVNGSGDVGDTYTSGTSWAGTATDDYYGNSSDDWNAGLTDADINASTFGVRFKCTSAGGATALVDCVEIEVFYSGGTVSDVPLVVTSRVRARAVHPLRTSQIFEPIYVGALNPQSDVPLVVFPGNVPAIARLQTSHRGGASTFGPITTESTSDLPPQVIRGGTGPHQRSAARYRPHSVIVLWSSDGHGDCNCEPGGAVVVAGSLGVVLVASDTNANVGAVTVVEKSEGRVQVVNRCDC